MVKPPFCPICHEITQIDAISIEEDYPLKRGTVRIKAQIYRCESCNGTFTDVAQEEFNYELAVEVFRKEKNLLFPHEIKSVRDKYELSQRQFCALLGWSPTTLSSYENNKIQDQSHNDELMLLKSPTNMMRVLDIHSKNLDDKVAAKLEERVKGLVIEERVELERHQLSNLYDDVPIGKMTGNRSFDLHRFVQVAVYMLKRSGPEYKTKFLKLPFFADFLSYKRHGCSITGAVYAHLPHGPVPDDFKSLIGFMDNEGYIEVSVREFEGGGGEVLAAKLSPDTSCFSKEDRDILDKVVDKFKTYSAGQIEVYSHKETAYKQTKPSERISYEFAKELSLD